jgi:hypothetical protein
MVEQHLADSSTHMMVQPFNIKWIPYRKFHVGNYNNIHHEKTSDLFCWWSPTELYTPAQF